mmetsp:Transcript_17617/g.61613  ORF Transcript_17617/g.61613 Transcript_17617/m.61613 type:complete len:331 (+) Transcript_17617:209-1201(+)
MQMFKLDKISTSNKRFKVQPTQYVKWSTLILLRARTCRSVPARWPEVLPPQRVQRHPTGIEVEPEPALASVRVAELVVPGLLRQTWCVAPGREVVVGGAPRDDREFVGRCLRVPSRLDAHAVLEQARVPDIVGEEQVRAEAVDQIKLLPRVALVLLDLFKATLQSGELPIATRHVLGAISRGAHVPAVPGRAQLWRRHRRLREYRSRRQGRKDSGEALRPCVSGRHRRRLARPLLLQFSHLLIDFAFAGRPPTPQGDLDAGLAREVPRRPLPDAHPTLGGDVEDKEQTRLRGIGAVDHMPSQSLVHPGLVQVPEAPGDAERDAKLRGLLA